MRFAITDPDPESIAVLAFAAQRRGHQTVALESSAELFQHLPFLPTVVVFSIDAGLADPAPVVQKLRAAFPGAVLIATLNMDEFA